MIEVLVVCTGNICRSPLAEVTLRARWEGAPVVVRSAGTRAVAGRPMAPESVALLTASAGGAVQALTRAGAHRARLLDETDLMRADLVLAMAREHRRHVVELAPSRLRRTFTVREFARLAEAVPTEALRAAVADCDLPDDRMRCALDTVAAMRGTVEPPWEPEEDDVIDPFGRSAEVYELSARQLFPALEQVDRVLSVVVPPPTT